MAKKITELNTKHNTTLLPEEKLKLAKEAQYYSSELLKRVLAASERIKNENR